MYDPETIEAELSVQLRGTPGDMANRTAFRDFVVNVQQFRVYLAMLGCQTHVSMIHTPGVYYSITSATSTYQQGKVLAFIGERRVTKKTTPICLPTSKAREWHTGNAVTDFDKFSEFYDVEANKGTMWTPTAGDGAPAELKLPNLVAIPNLLVDLLRTQGYAVTPYDVLVWAALENFPARKRKKRKNVWFHVGTQKIEAKRNVTKHNSCHPQNISDFHFQRWWQILRGSELRISQTGTSEQAANKQPTSSQQAPNKFQRLLCYLT
jgi:hypothetical protein